MRAGLPCAPGLHMNHYGKEVITQVLSAVDIADVIGGSLHLQPNGPGRYKALCPFHSEKTPSFVVNRSRQTFHCFGCGKGGDAIRFVTEHEGLSFVEALRKLADRGGVRLPALRERDDKAEYLRQQLLEFGKFASAHFRENLESPLKGSAGRQYLKTRQLNPETVRRFALGYAPESYDNLLEAARAKGFKDTVLEASGLLKAGGKGGLYDFFRNRLMFPIKDTSANVVAFGGRDLGGESPAKYINSPETPVYRKSRVLYGLSEAREALRKQQHALLVEGYFDLLRCFDAGIENVVASCGTALTEEQATLIKRYVPEVTIVYDGDNAGIKAALKATGILIRAGLGVKAMALPGGQDPDDFIKAAGGPAFLDLVAQAPDFVTYYATMSGDRASSIEGRTAIAHEIFAMLVTIDDAVRRDEYLKRTAQALGLNLHACRTEFEKYRREEERPGPSAPAPAEGEAPAAAAFHRDDLEFLSALMEQPALLGEARARLAETPLPAGPLGTVLGDLLSGEANGHANPAWAEEAARLYAAAACMETKVESVAELVRKRLVRLALEAAQARCAGLERDLQEAERVRDFALMGKLLQDVIEARRAVEALGRA